MIRIIPCRKIEGISAVLLPFHEEGTPDYGSFLAHVDRTYAAGLTPAVNMDTGYVNLLTQDERCKILDLMAAAASGRRFGSGPLSKASLVSGCYPLDEFYKGRSEAEMLRQAKGK